MKNPDSEFITWAIAKPLTTSRKYDFLLYSYTYVHVINVCVCVFLKYSWYSDNFFFIS